MRIFPALIAFGVLAGTTSASAMPARMLSFGQVAISPELVVVRRSGALHGYRHHDHRYHGPRQHRKYVEPQTRAAPMERVPQVAPLAPRVGK